jgi:Transcriptional regulator SbtR-like, C-terminal domain
LPHKRKSSPKRRPDGGAHRVLRLQVAYGKSKRGLGVAVKAMLSSDSEVLSWCRETLRGALGGLLEAAQKTGEIREDIEPAIVLRLAHGVAVGSETAPEESDRLLAIVIDSLRTR